MLATYMQRMRNNNLDFLGLQVIKKQSWARFLERWLSLTQYLAKF